jgi:hypothetical protein
MVYTRKSGLSRGGWTAVVLVVIVIIIAAAVLATRPTHPSTPTTSATSVSTPTTSITHNYHFELYKHHAKYHHNFSVHPPASK